VEYNYAAHEGDQLISLAEMERRHVKRVLAALEGNITKAAEVFGIGRTTLYRLLRRTDPADEVHGTAAGQGEK
jgi:transcriptional regulator of acetoin/glycerol metabolism